MRDITLAIHEDHKTIQRLLHKLTWETDKHRWKELVQQAARLIQLHLEAEEEAVYARLLFKKSSAFIAKHSQQEHGEISKFVRRLQAAPPDSTSAIENFATVRYLFVEHVSEEEEALFPLLTASFNDEEMDEMFHAYSETKARIINEAAFESAGDQRASGEIS